LDQGRLIFVLANDLTARVDHIGENHAGTAKNVIFQHDGIKDGNIVLDLHVVADLYIAHIDILTERAIGANLRGWTDVNPVPNSRPRSDLRARIDDRGWVRDI